eukprot:1263344-Pleurochrysis_carterae.AAC.2
MQVRTQVRCSKRPQARACVPRLRVGILASPRACSARARVRAEVSPLRPSKCASPSASHACLPPQSSRYVHGHGCVPCAARCGCERAYTLDALKHNTGSLQTSSRGSKRGYDKGKEQTI